MKYGYLHGYFLKDLFRTELKIHKMAGVTKHMAPNMQQGLSRTLEVW